jgi:hypothetical protein
LAEEKRRLLLQNERLQKVLKWGLDHVGGWREVIAEWDDFGKSEALGKAMLTSLDQIDVWRGDVREVLRAEEKPKQEATHCPQCGGILGSPDYGCTCVVKRVASSPIFNANAPMCSVCGSGITGGGADRNGVHQICAQGHKT